MDGKRIETKITELHRRRAGNFSKFVRKYGVPTAILLGFLMVSASIYLSFGMPNRQQPAQQQAPKVAGEKITIETAGLPMLGNREAEVAIVEFADFQCPFCGRFFSQTLGLLKENYISTGKVRFYLNDFAFLGPESEYAAQAAKCAGEQGKFWEYHDYLYTHQNGENQGAFSLASLKNFAAELGLKESDFNNCLGSKKYEKAVRDETNRGKNYGVDRTPTLFINGEKIVGALPYDVFASKIDEALQKK